MTIAKFRELLWLAWCISVYNQHRDWLSLPSLWGR